ncbi:unnamed protein product [Zymoseptoria tritici ST99CH_1A5]|uniref:Protein kinase domain-containing protein n=1 Tax=Zymoseptoria tritici ST99CH_1A5 TaxID=1276529 RepID=A0A1Y6LTU0_ZYMTR|nr:unnamed protein product [Zymoseptoria tritici ST99CH_1A5]
MSADDRASRSREEVPTILPVHNVRIEVDLPTPTAEHPPSLPIRHLSAPAYQSPLRHHRRAPSRSKGVKETLDARSHYGSSDDDGGAVHRINQYVIKQEIGRGSFGAVHLAVDQYGAEFAVKEFSKSRLRKRAQSNLLRKPAHARRPGQLAAGVGGFNSPLHRQSSSDKATESNNSLSLIKEEIAIMKKLDHHNLVSLIEVLDDPQEDSLYMVLEMCKKGVVMKVSVEERAHPYEQEACRCWFRDMILGIEYLHAQGIIHRDIKPDNCLITHDDVLKIVDFGVSEMFEKESDMHTAKSAGSPAFMPPELCVVKHGAVSGKAADIWSMGVTLYCLRYGRIPFEQTNMLELYESIKADDVDLENEQDKQFEDLMHRLLEKNPDKRITMDELRVHPWVTKGGTDPLLSAEENCANLVEPPTEAEMDDAITGNMSHLMIVMKAVKRFKKLVRRKRPEILESIFGRESRFTRPPDSVHATSKSADAQDRKTIESALAVEGVHKETYAGTAAPTLDGASAESPMSIPTTHSSPHRDDGFDSPSTPRPQTDQQTPLSSPEHPSLMRDKSNTFPLDDRDRAKGQAHDPLEDRLFLHIGSDPDTYHEPNHEHPIISESPSGVDEDIYERAYQEEMRRILEEKASADLVLTRRVEHIERLRRHPNVLASSINHAIDFAGISASRMHARAKNGHVANFVREAKVKARERRAEDSGGNTPSSSERPSPAEGGGSGFSSFVREARDKARERKAEESSSSTTSRPQRSPLPEEDAVSGLDGSSTSSSGQSGGGDPRRFRDMARSSAGDVLKGVAKRLDDRATKLQVRGNSSPQLPTSSSSAS